MNLEKTMEIITETYIAACKNIMLQSIEEEYRDAVEEALSLNDGEFITDKEIIEVYINVLEGFKC